MDKKIEIINNLKVEFKPWQGKRIYVALNPFEMKAKGISGNSEIGVYDIATASFECSKKGGLDRIRRTLATDMATIIAICKSM
jgi:hypothetical protein